MLGLYALNTKWNSPNLPNTSRQSDNQLGHCSQSVIKHRLSVGLEIPCNHPNIPQVLNKRLQVILQRVQLTLKMAVRGSHLV